MSLGIHIQSRLARICWDLLCRFYFAYCEAAFDARYIHNFQILWQKAAEPQMAPSPLAPSSSEALSKPLGTLIAPMQSAPSDPVMQVRPQVPICMQATHGDTEECMTDCDRWVTLMKRYLKTYLPHMQHPTTLL